MKKYYKTQLKQIGDSIGSLNRKGIIEFEYLSPKDDGLNIIVEKTANPFVVREVLTNTMIPVIHISNYIPAYCSYKYISSPGVHTFVSCYGHSLRDMQDVYGLQLITEPEDLSDYLNKHADIEQWASEIDEYFIKGDQQVEVYYIDKQLDKDFSKKEKKLQRKRMKELHNTIKRNKE